MFSLQEVLHCFVASIATKTSSESLFEMKSDEVEKVVSCPSLPEDDHYSIGEYFIKNSSEQQRFQSLFYLFVIFTRKVQ